MCVRASSIRLPAPSSAPAAGLWAAHSSVHISVAICGTGIESARCDSSVPRLRPWAGAEDLPSSPTFHLHRGKWTLCLAPHATQEQSVGHMSVPGTRHGNAHPLRGSAVAPAYLLPVPWPRACVKSRPRGPSPVQRLNDAAARGHTGFSTCTGYACPRPLAQAYKPGGLESKGGPRPSFRHSKLGESGRSLPPRNWKKCMHSGEVFASLCICIRSPSYKATTGTVEWEGEGDVSRMEQVRVGRPGPGTGLPITTLARRQSWIQLFPHCRGRKWTVGLASAALSATATWAVYRQLSSRRSVQEEGQEDGLGASSSGRDPLEDMLLLNPQGRPGTREQVGVHGGRGLGAGLTLSIKGFRSENSARG